MSRKKSKKSDNSSVKSYKDGVYMNPMTMLKSGIYSPTEDQELRDNYPEKGSKWCANKLNRSVPSIMNRIHRLGLKMTAEGKWKIKAESYKRPNDWYKINPEQFFNVQKPEAAYMLGFLWADGYVKIPKRSGGGNYILALNISKPDFEALNKAFDPLGKWGTYKVKKTVRHRVETICIRTGNKPLVEFLVAHDYSIKSLCAPTKILSHIPDHLKHYFWRGYFDGDGTFTCKKRHYLLGFSGAYGTDWKEHKKMLESIGVAYSYFQEKRESGNSSSLIGNNVSNVVRFGDYIYQGYDGDQIGLKRKWDKYDLAREIMKVCEQVNAIKFKEPSNFIKTKDDFLALLRVYPSFLSRKRILEYFDIPVGSLNHIIYVLTQEGKIRSHRGKCSFYTML